MAEKKPTIGVLALQGDFEAHCRTLEKLGADVVFVRKPEQLQNIDGLIIPGGESSTFLKFLEKGGFLDVLKTFVSSKPTFGTCAGTILLANQVENPRQRALGALDITVRRNAYGRQLDSSIEYQKTKFAPGTIEMVFIRAPKITRVGKDVEVLARRGKDPVLVKRGNIMAATFHPELSHHSPVHRLFLQLVRQHLINAKIKKRA